MIVRLPEKSNLTECIRVASSCQQGEGKNCDQKDSKRSQVETQEGSGWFRREEELLNKFLYLEM